MMTDLAALRQPFGGPGLLRALFLAGERHSGAREGGMGTRHQSRQLSVVAVPKVRKHRENDMISEMKIHSIARQMLEKHGHEAIVQAAQNAVACENKGNAEEAREWRH